MDVGKNQAHNVIFNGEYLKKIAFFDLRAASSPIILMKLWYHIAFNGGETVVC